MSRLSLLTPSVSPVDASLGQPNLAIPDGPNFAQGLAAAGRSIGAGVSDLAGSLYQKQQRDEALAKENHNAEMRRYITEQQPKFLQLQQQAIEASKDADNTGAATDIVRDIFSPMEDQINALEDADAKAALRLDLAQHYHSTLNHVTARAQQLGVSKTVAAIDATQDQLLAGVRTGTTSLGEAIASHQRIINLNAPLIGPEASQKATEQFNSRAVREEYARLEKSPDVAEVFLSTDIARRYITGDQLQSMHDRLDYLKKKQDQELIDSTEQGTDQWINQITGPGAAPPDPAIIAERLDQRAKAVHELNPKIDVDQWKYGRLAASLEAAAKAVNASGIPQPDMVMFNSLAKAMPQTGQARTTENELRAYMTRAVAVRKKTETDAEIVKRIYSTRSPIEAGYHPSPEALTSLYKSSDPIEAIKWMQTNDIALPNAVISDIAADLNPPTQDFPAGLAKLEAIESFNPDRAAKIAESVGKGSPVAKVLWDTTRGVDPTTREAIIKTLSNPRADNAITDAGHALAGDKITDKIKPIGAVVPPPNLTQDQYGEFASQFKLAMADLRVNKNDARPVDDQAASARTIAVNQLNRSYVPMRSPNLDHARHWYTASSEGQVLAPVSAVGAVGSAKFNAIQEAVLAYGETLDPTNPFSEGNTFVHPEMAFSDGRSTYIPAINSDDALDPVKGVLKYDTDTGKSYQIDATNDPATFNTIKAEIHRRQSPESFNPLDSLRWRSDYGRVSVADYDKRYPSVTDGMVFKIMSSVANDLAKMGNFQSMPKEMQDDLLNRYAERRAILLGWPGFQPSAEPAAKP